MSGDSLPTLGRPSLLAAKTRAELIFEEAVAVQVRHLGEKGELPHRKVPTPRRTVAGDGQLTCGAESVKLDIPEGEEEDEKTSSSSPESLRSHAGAATRSEPARPLMRSAKIFARKGARCH